MAPERESLYFIMARTAKGLGILYSFQYILQNVFRNYKGNDNFVSELLQSQREIAEEENKNRDVVIKVLLAVWGGC